jgi:hypothetical protein
LISIIEKKLKQKYAYSNTNKQSETSSQQHNLGQGSELGDYLERIGLQGEMNMSNFIINETIDSRHALKQMSPRTSLN